MPLLVEIMGPAAAGKTTLVQTLCAEDAGIRAGLGLRKAAYVGPLFRRLVVFLPVWALHYRRDRWLDRREMRSIARLETWSRALERPITHTDVAVFDHGPLYRLARLREFGPALIQSRSFDRWWRRSSAHWLEALDMVVLLEASDEALLHRVDQRGHWFLSGDHSEREKQAFLARYRRSFAGILQDVDARPTILRFRSDESPVDAIASEVLEAIASMRSASDPRERAR